jgi:PAS domain S-box-containing protein
MFEAWFELCPDPLSVHRLSDGGLVRVNGAWRRLTGLREAEALDRSPLALGILPHPEEWEAIQSELLQSPTGGPREVRVRARDGQERRLLLRASRLSAGGEEMMLALATDLTEYQRIETEWLESEAAFRTVFEESPVPLYLHRDGRIVHVNGAALHLFGAREADQLIGQPVADRTPAGERARQEARLQAALDGAPEPRFTETRILTLAGEEVDVEALDRPVTYQGRPTLLASIHDIRERRQSEKALADALDLLELSGELAKVGGSRLQVDTLKQSWTRQTFRILDLEPGAAPTFEEGLAFYTPEARPVIRAAVRACMETGTPFDLELPAVTARGRSIQIRTQGIAVIEGGRTLEVIRVFQDVTELRRREDQERVLERQLHHAERMEGLARLAGGIAHDINNVLASVLALATVHRRKAAEGSPLRQDMELVAEACFRGGSLAQSLMDFAREEPRERRPVNLNDLVRGALKGLDPAASRGVALRLELDQDLRDLDGEAEVLGQAIRGLCRNALEAMPEGGTLRLRTENEGPGGVLLEVEDSGAGMDPEVQRQALAPFYTTKQASGHSGLGLALVDRVVASHQGTLDLQSEPGRGTLVRLRFPAPPAEPTGQSAPPAQSGPSRSAPPGDPVAAIGRSLLLVDDDPAIRHALPGLLESLGHSVQTAESGEQALALLDGGSRPDLVLLDVNMPGIGGLETLHRLRQRTMVPVLLCSGFPTQAVMEAIQRQPEVRLLEKPYTADLLQRLIRESLP